MKDKKYVLIDKPRQMQGGTTTGVVKAFDYIIGLGVFGFLYYILNPLAEIFNNRMIVDNQDFVMFLWYGCLVIYLVFGAFYFLNSLKEWNAGE